MLTTLSRRPLPTLNFRTFSFKPSSTTTTTGSKKDNTKQHPHPHHHHITIKEKDPIAEVPSLLISVPLAASGTIAGGLAAYLGGAEARASHLSPIGAFVLTTLGGCGGGTFRACLSGQPAAWIGAPGYMYACLALGGAGYLGLLERLRTSRAGQLFMKTIFKMSIPGCAIVGGEIARNTNAYTGMLFGLITATGGGFIRDVILSRPPAALHYGNTFVEAAPVMAGALFHSLIYEPLRTRPNVRYLSTILGTLWLNRYLTKHYLNNGKNIAMKNIENKNKFGKK